MHEFLEQPSTVDPCLLESVHIDELNPQLRLDVVSKTTQLVQCVLKKMVSPHPNRITAVIRPSLPLDPITTNALMEYPNPAFKRHRVGHKAAQSLPLPVFRVVCVYDRCNHGFIVRSRTRGYPVRWFTKWTTRVPSEEPPQ